ncbi:hypothetical protein AcW1_003931 [Taiwanofungus camphoratus]|nr:hypothetical protein AcW1_003931 [Antrodia cinnamomea]
MDRECAGAFVHIPDRLARERDHHTVPYRTYLLMVLQGSRSSQGAPDHRSSVVGGGSIGPRHRRGGGNTATTHKPPPRANVSALNGICRLFVAKPDHGDVAQACTDALFF